MKGRNLPIYTKDLKLIKEYEKLLAEVDVVSFDIFDTLLYRLVYQPVDIFIVAQLEGKYRWGIDLPDDFWIRRISAEKKARQKYIKEGVEDITYDQIYEFISLELPFTSDKDIAILKKLEIDLEKKFNVAHPIGKILFELALAHGKRIILTSDMYLPQKVVQRILTGVGYPSNLTIRMSSEFRKGKYTGSLFKEILKEEKIMPRRLLHVGDNRISDVLMPRKLGIRSLYLPQLKDMLPHTFPFFKQWNSILRRADGIESHIIKSIVWGLSTHRVMELLLSEEGNKDKKIGQIITALYTFPALVDYVLWLMKVLREDDGAFENMKVAFLARDNYLMHQLYKALEDMRTYNKLPEGEYVYSSRRLYIFPTSLISNDLNEAMFYIVTGKAGTTIENIISRLGLKIPHDILKRQLRQHNLMLTTQISSKNYKRVTIFMQSLFSVLKKYALEEFRVLSAYLKRLFSNNIETLIISDLGWSGSMIVGLARLLGGVFRRKIKPIGLMFGVDPNRGKYTEVAALGGKLRVYLNLLSNQKDARIIHDEGVEVVENLYPAPHGSIIKIKREGESFVPVTAFVPKENRLKYSILLNESQALIEKFVNLAPRIKIKDYSPDPDFFALPLLSLIKLEKMPKALVKWVATMQHSAGWGDDRSYSTIAYPTATSIPSLYRQWRNVYWKKAFVMFLPVYTRVFLYLYHIYYQMKIKFKGFFSLTKRKALIGFNYLPHLIKYLPLKFKEKQYGKDLHETISK